MTAQKKYSKIATGTNDQITDKIVSEMWRLIKRDYKHPKIVAKAKELRMESRWDTLEAVFNFVHDSYPYKSDPADEEHLTAPIHIIEGNAPYMDCDELVIITCALLKAMNIPVLIKVIAWRKQEFTHVVCEAQLNENKWLVMDLTRSDGFGNQEKKVIREKRYKG